MRENVYDTASGQYLLIPQGSRLVGKYDSRLAYAQNALLVARRPSNVPAHIMIRTGTRFSVRVHRDLLFEAPYRPYVQGGERVVAAGT